MPFAVAGALLSFGSGATTGVGVLILVFALIGFANAKRDGTIPSDLRALPVWLAASAVCVLAPYGFLRLPSALFSTPASTIIPAVGGWIAFLAGAFLFYFHLKAEKKKNKKD